MVDKQTVAEALAGVVAVANVVFVAAMSLTINSLWGLWPAIAVGAFLTVVFGVVLLFAVGQLDEQRRRNRQGRF